MEPIGARGASVGNAPARVAGVIAQSGTVPPLASA